MTTREPLVIRAAIVAALTALLHVLVVLGVTPIEPEAETAVAGFIDLLGTAVLVVWVRGKVTPVDDPRLPADVIPDGDGKRRATPSEGHV
jgi:hypothetical protein